MEDNIHPFPAHDASSHERDIQLAELLSQLQLDGVDSSELDEVCAQHPDLADELRQLWAMVAVTDVAAEFSAEMENIVDSSTTVMPNDFGDYKLIEEIGRGGMGVVYKARQQSLNRTVAVKMLLQGDLATLEQQGRFRQEAESAAGLTHAGIVPVYEVGDADGRPYFSMKFIDGKPLSDILLSGPMDISHACRIAIQVCDAIHFAHRKGILHRDLKPSNILIDSDGHAHVTDFGLAKQISTDKDLTQTGVVIGTPAYMSPEQAAGERGEIGTHSDIYSLGALLYHMITGRPLFQAATPVDIVLMVLQEEPVSPRLLNSKIPRDVEMIVQKSIQKPVDLRYGSAESLSADLSAFLHDEVVSARSGRLGHVVARLFSETHHSHILQNWGRLWMWHSLALFVVCVVTNLMHLNQIENRWSYFALWTAGLGAWSSVFWGMRRKMGPVTFVERQIAHAWGASMLAIALLFPVEWLLDQPPLALAPVLALVSGTVFTMKAGILGGRFYIHAIVLFATAPVMAVFPRYALLVFGAVSALCFFIPGLQASRRS